MIVLKSDRKNNAHVKGLMTVIDDCGHHSLHLIIPFVLTLEIKLQQTEWLWQSILYSVT